MCEGKLTSLLVEFEEQIEYTMKSGIYTVSAESVGPKSQL